MKKKNSSVYLFARSLFLLLFITCEPLYSFGLMGLGHSTSSAGDFATASEVQYSSVKKIAISLKHTYWRLQAKCRATGRVTTAAGSE